MAIWKSLIEMNVSEGILILHRYHMLQSNVENWENGMDDVLYHGLWFIQLYVWQTWKIARENIIMVFGMGHGHPMPQLDKWFRFNAHTWISISRNRHHSFGWWFFFHSNYQRQSCSDWLTYFNWFWMTLHRKFTSKWIFVHFETRMKHFIYNIYEYEQVSCSFRAILSFDWWRRSSSLFISTCHAFDKHTVEIKNRATYLTLSRVVVFFSLKTVFSNEIHSLNWISLQFRLIMI